MLFVFKVLFAALMIAFASWLSGKKPELAGFIIALPLASILVLAFSYIEHKNIETSVLFAKSIALGVPISYLFFLPFFLYKQINFNFWIIYIIGILLIVAGFFIHKLIMNIL
ncbi:hypothetical protein OAB63_00025 [Alphaproteobacteria bacterium]|nr:hypothetical protein [Alphaproteobacteria bacterium]